MATASSKEQNGRAVTIKKTFSREISVHIEINASASIIWGLLTDAHSYPRWDPTIISVTGNIAPGEKIHLISKLDPKRVFKLKVKEFVPDSRLVWGDVMGNRVYSLIKNDDGAVLFTMTEKMGGPLFPLFAKMIPSFDKSFEQFAAALKKEAENIMNQK